MIQIIDNALPEETFKSIKRNVLSADQWEEERIISREPATQFVLKVYNGYQPLHPLFFELVEGLFPFLIPSAFIRVKINKMLKTKEPYLPDYHTDFKDCLTAILHLSTTNGKTVFKNGIEVDGIENRLIIFDSNLLHSGYTCTDKEERIAVNINFFRRVLEEEIYA